MWYYSKEIRIAFFSLMIGLFLIPILQSSFSQIDEESITELSEEDLELIEEYLEQARTLFEQRYTEGAIFHYDKVLAIDPLNIDALNGKAIVLDFVGSHEEAISYFDEVLLIDSKNVDALLGKAFALDNLGKTEEAISYFDKVLDLEEIQQSFEDIPDESLESLQEFFEIAQELLDEESFEEAISYYDEVLAIDSSDIDALNGKALALTSIGDYEEAIFHYDKVLEVDPKNNDAIIGKSFALENLDSTEGELYFD